MNASPASNFVPASYSLPPEMKKRIEKMARADLSNPSVIVRRIIAAYFAQHDASGEQASSENGSSKLERG